MVPITISISVPFPGRTDRPLVLLKPKMGTKQRTYWAFLMQLMRCWDGYEQKGQVQNLEAQAIHGKAWGQEAIWHSILAMQIREYYLNYEQIPDCLVSRLTVNPSGETGKQVNGAKDRAEPRTVPYRRG